MTAVTRVGIIERTADGPGDPGLALAATGGVADAAAPPDPGLVLLAERGRAQRQPARVAAVLSALECPALGQRVARRSGRSGSTMSRQGW